MLAGLAKSQDPTLKQQALVQIYKSPSRSVRTPSTSSSSIRSFRTPNTNSLRCSRKMTPEGAS